MGRDVSMNEIELEAFLEANRMIVEDEHAITEAGKTKTRHDDPLAYKRKLISLSNWLLHRMEFNEKVTQDDVDVCLKALHVADQAINEYDAGVRTDGKSLRVSIDRFCKKKRYNPSLFFNSVTSDVADGPSNVVVDGRVKDVASYVDPERGIQINEFRMGDEDRLKMLNVVSMGGNQINQFQSTGGKKRVRVENVVSMDGKQINQFQSTDGNNRVHVENIVSMGGRQENEFEYGVSVGNVSSVRGVQINTFRRHKSN